MASGENPVKSRKQQEASIAHEGRDNSFFIKNPGHLNKKARKKPKAQVI